MGEWISVESEMPDMGQVVLVWGCDEEPITAYRLNDIPYPRWQDYQDPAVLTLTGISHWMPLPPPPKGE